MHRLQLFSFWIIVVTCAAGSAYAQEQQPPKEALADAISQLVPPYWSISDIKVTASVNLGDAVDPNVKQRFEAIVSPSVALFVRDAESEGAYGPFVPVLPSLNADSARTLYGVVNATYVAGQWSIATKLENDVSQLGMPLEMFGAPTVVRGSEEEAALRERLRADVAERMRHQLAAEEERVRTEHAAKVRTLRSQHQEEIEQVQTQHAAAVTKLKGEVAATEEGISTNLKRLAANHVADLKDLKERQERERTQLLKDQEQNLGILKVQHDEEMKRLEQQLAQAADKARAEIQARMDLVALEREKQDAQARLLEAQRETAKRDAQLAEERRQAEIAARGREMKAAEEQRQHEANLRRSARADHAKQLSTLETAVSGEDQQAAVAAFQAALASGDDALRTSAMQEAFSSASKILKALALQHAIMNSSVISFAYNAKSGQDQFSGSFAIHMANKAASNGTVNFNGKWQGGIFTERYFKDDNMRGVLNGSIISATSNYCSLTAQLAKGSRLEGTMQCGDYLDVPGISGTREAVFAIATNVQ